MEFEILKTLKYKILYSTPLDFNDIYLEIISNLLKKIIAYIFKKFFLPLEIFQLI